MKMKKSISLLCCVIIASMGIILTGCGNSSNNKDSENSGEKYADSPYVGTWEAKVAESRERFLLFLLRFFLPDKDHLLDPRVVFSL